MHAAPPFDQDRGEVVEVGDWEPDEWHPVFPIGQKPKRLLICPTPAPHRFLLAGHRYLFKEPTGFAAPQIWSEVLAYKLSRHLPLEVPPAFLGVDSRTNRAGVLVEFFIGHGARTHTQFVHAREAFQARGSPFSQRRGSLRQNIALSRAHGVPDAVSWWGRTIAFDTLIGNTDRHSENWGFLVDRAPGEDATHALAPAFDNGSSMGFIVREDDLPARSHLNAIARAVAKGRHHMTWLPGEASEHARHDHLAARFAGPFQRAADAMRPFAVLSDAVVDSALAECEGSLFPVAFSAARAHYVRALLTARRAILRRSLGV